MVYWLYSYTRKLVAPNVANRMPGILFPWLSDRKSGSLYWIWQVAGTIAETIAKQLAWGYTPNTDPGT
ncbi:MAG TPA: hypothetical protein VF359_02900 [Anaerolineales bacterium]